MIVFHEGLPGAGKSYEACLYHILPAIKAGRPVITNIEGINHEKFAELSGIPVRFVREMIKCVFFPEIADDEQRLEKQRRAFVEDTEADSLVVIDEIQDLWPSNRQKMEPTEQKFFTEHRHKGLDIICMGQDRRDCHNIIRRRIKRVIVFVQLTALGAPTRYQWTAYEATKPECYKKIQSGPRKYEKKYFGLYASHTGATKNTEVYKDDRINVFKTAYFRYGVPAFFLFLCVAVYNLVSFFNPDTDTFNTKAHASVVDPAPVNFRPAISAASDSVAPAVVDQQNIVRTPHQAQPVLAEQPEKKEPEFMDVFDRDINKWRPRLAGIVVIGDRMEARVEILDGTFHRKDVYSLEAIKALGWTVAYNPAGLVVEKEKQKHIIRPWPVDSWGEVSAHVKAKL